MSAERGPRSRRLSRRTLLSSLLVAAPSAASSSAASSPAAKRPAGDYLTAAWWLVQEASRAGEFLRPRLSDRKLAEVLRRIAEGRLSAAQRLDVPEEVGVAHPHLLLMLEHYERAAAAAVVGDTKRGGVLLRDALQEEQLFRSILKQLGMSLGPGP